METFKSRILSSCVHLAPVYLSKNVRIKGTGHTTEAITFHKESEIGSEAKTSSAIIASLLR